MLRTIALAAIASFAVLPASAQDHEEEGGGGGHDEAHVTDYAFSFEGPFGSYDQHQLQRGLQVYTEICASCHGLRYVSFRSLHEETGPGLPEDQVRAYAAFYEAFDPELDDYRTAIPTDHFPQSALPNAPDLSLMAKARAGFHGPYGSGLNQLFRGMGGPEYIVSLLDGYTGEEKEEAGAVLYENTAFAGGWIGMPPPLLGEDVEFEDGSPNDVLSESKDLAAFLMWAAEPKLAARKQVGFSAVFLLAVLSVLLYLVNKRIWAPVKRGPRKTPAE